MACKSIRASNTCRNCLRMYYVSYMKYIKIPLELLVSFNYHVRIGKVWNEFEDIYIETTRYLARINTYFAEITRIFK